MSPEELALEVQKTIPIGLSVATMLVRATLSAFALLSVEVSRTGVSTPDPVEFRRAMSQKCREWMDYNPF